MAELTDQVALVTGGGRGIGRGAVVELAKAGAAVAINYHRDREAAVETAELVKRAGGRALLLPGDVSDLAAVEKMVQDTVEAFGRLAIAVGNAAYSDRELFLRSRYGRISPHDRRHHVGFLLSAARGRPADDFARAGAGRSCSSARPTPTSPSRGRWPTTCPRRPSIRWPAPPRMELIEHRIRVNIVTPGWIDTPGERKFASRRNHCRGRQEAALGAAGTARRNRSRRGLFLRSGAATISPAPAADRRRHHACPGGPIVAAAFRSNRHSHSRAPRAARLKDQPDDFS